MIARVQVCRTVRMSIIPPTYLGSLASERSEDAAACIKVEKRAGIVLSIYLTNSLKSKNSCYEFTVCTFRDPPMTLARSEPAERHILKVSRYSLASPLICFMGCRAFLLACTARSRSIFISPLPSTTARRFQSLASSRILTISRLPFFLMAAM